MTKTYQIRHHQIRFFKLKMHQNPFSARNPLGELTTLPRPLVGWGGGYPVPIPLPAPRRRRLGSQAPQHKILATPVFLVWKFCHRQSQ